MPKSELPGPWRGRRHARRLALGIALWISGLLILPIGQPSGAVQHREGAQPAAPRQELPVPPGCERGLPEGSQVWGPGDYRWSGFGDQKACQLTADLSIRPGTTITIAGGSALAMAYGTRLEAVASPNGGDIRLIGDVDSINGFHICSGCNPLSFGSMSLARIEGTSFENLQVTAAGGQIELLDNRFAGEVLSFAAQRYTAAADQDPERRQPLQLEMRGNRFEGVTVRIPAQNAPDWHDFEIRGNCFESDAWLDLTDLQAPDDPSTIPDDFDLQGNWWGHPDGPRSPANPGGVGARIRGAEARHFSPWLREPPRDCAALDEIELRYEQPRIDPGQSTVAILTFRDEQGAPLAGEPVSLALDPPEPSSGRLDRPSAVTDARGVVQVVYRAPEDEEGALGAMPGESKGVQRSAARFGAGAEGLASSWLDQQPAGTACGDRLPRLVARIERLRKEKRVPAPLGCMVHGFVKLHPDANMDAAHVAEAAVDLIAGGQVVSSTFLAPHGLAAEHSDKPWARAYYRFITPADFDLASSYELRLRLQDRRNTIQVYGRPTATDVLSITWRATADTASRRIWHRRDMTRRFHFAAELREPAITASEAEFRAFGYGLFNYWHLWTNVHGYWSTLQRTLRLQRGVELPDMAYQLPLELYLNEARFAANTYYCSVQSAPKCGKAGSIHLDPGDSTTNIPDTLLHEMGHHVVRELYGSSGIGRPAAPAHEINHDGYANSYSSDSLDEGFATFYSALVRDRAYGWRADRGRFTWSNGASIHLNLQHRAWSHRRDASDPPSTRARRSEEEDAVFGLLWDLIDDDQGDSARSNETFWTHDGSMFHPRDELQIAPRIIIEALALSKPKSVRGLYRSLRDRLPAELTEADQNPRGSGLSRLDELFVMQRIFHDADGDWSFDLGEEVGRPAHSAPWQGGWTDGAGQVVSTTIAARPGREALPPTEGSFIRLDLRDGEGRALEEATLEVEIDLGPGTEALDYGYEQVVRSGDVQIEMPPPNYEDARASFRLRGSADPPAVLENRDYWARQPAEAPMLDLQFVIRRQPTYLPLLLARTISRDPLPSPSPTGEPGLPPLPSPTPVAVGGPRVRWARITDDANRPRMVFSAAEDIKLWLRVELPPGAPAQDAQLDLEIYGPDGDRMESMSWSGSHRLLPDRPSVSLERELPDELETGPYRFVGRLTAGDRSQESEALFLVAQSLQYADDFDDPASGWPIGPQASGHYAYVDGSLEMRVDLPYRRLWATRGEARISDGAFELVASRRSRVDALAGLIFGRDSQADLYSLLQIDGLGRWRLLHRGADGLDRIVLPWRHSPTIDAGADWNLLAVMRRGSRLDLYSNWQRMATVEADWLPASGTVGLSGASLARAGARLRFDRLRVYRFGPALLHGVPAD